MSSIFIQNIPHNPKNRGKTVCTKKRCVKIPSHREAASAAVAISISRGGLPRPYGARNDRRFWGDTLILSYIRTILLYLLLIAVVRLMGKRQIGQMEPAEFVVTMLVANLAAIPMQDGGIPLYSGLIPIVTVLGVELVLSALSMKSVRLRKLLCGKPVILVENGNILQKNLRKTRITLDELTGHLREKDVLDLQSVQYAILETNGNLSVFPYPKEKPASAKEAGVQVKRQYLPVTIISDGEIIPENLAKAGKNTAWVRRILLERQATVEDTWLLTVDGSDRIVFYRREGS